MSFDLFIQGEKYKTYNDWQIQQCLSGNPSNRFSVLVEDTQREPQAGDIAEFKDETTGDVLFLGVLNQPTTPAYSTGAEVKKYSITCSTLNALLKNRIPNISYSDITIGELVNELYDIYIAPEGIGVGEISEMPEPIFKIFNSNSNTLFDIMNDLAGYVEGSWHISTDKKFYFTIKNEFERVEITENNSFFNSLQKSESDREIRTRQIQDGGRDKTSPQDEYFTYYTGDSEISTRFVLADYPVIYAGADKDHLNKCNDVINEDELTNTEIRKDDYLFLFNKESRIIKINPTYTGSFILADGYVIQVLYIGFFNIRIEVDNVDKQAEIKGKTGFTGIIEKLERDTTLTNADEIYERANQTLFKYGESRKTLSLTITSEIINESEFDVENIQLSKMWVFDLPNLRITGEYVLTKISISQSVGSDEFSFVYKLEFSNRDFVNTYAKTIQNLYKKDNTLSVGADVKIQKYFNLSEKTNLSERFIFGKIVLKNYVCQSLENGQIATPLGTLYPYLC